MKRKMVVFTMTIFWCLACKKVGAQIISLYAGGGSGYTEGAPATSVAVPVPFSGSFDDRGDFYFSAGASDCKILMIDTNGLIHTVAGNGHCGYSGDGTSATTAEINNSCASVVDRAGNIYLADWLN